MLDPYVNDVNNVPIGISKRSLKVYGYNFFADKGNIISAQEISSTIGMLKTIIYSIRKTKNLTFLIDTEQELSSIGGIVDTYVDKDFEDFLLQFEKFLDSKIDGVNIKVLCIIAGLEKFQNSINQKKFAGFFKGIKELENVNLLFVDSSYKLKKVGFESWYTGVVNNSNGIWVGTGFAEQAVLKVLNYDKATKQDIDDRFAWIVKNGKTELIKTIGKKKSEDE